MKIDRIDIIGQNGNAAEHYEQPEQQATDQKPADYQYTDNTNYFGEDVR